MLADYGIRVGLMLAWSALAWSAGYFQRSVTHRAEYKRELSKAQSRVERILRLEEERRLVEICRECRVPLHRTGADLECIECERVFTQRAASGTYRA